MAKETTEKQCKAMKRSLVRLLRGAERGKPDPEGGPALRALKAAAKLGNGGPDIRTPPKPGGSAK